MARDTQYRFRQPSRQTLGNSPFLAFYEVTQTCDTTSAQRRANAQPKPRPGELTTLESLRLIDQLAKFPWPPLLVLTGDDSFQRSDIFELVSHAARRRLDVTITLSANSRVPPNAIRHLRGAGVSRFAIGIDGADARTHDMARGVSGSYYRNLQILRDARAEGVPTQVNTTVTPHNVTQIDRMAELFAHAEIAMWSVFFRVPVGRAALAPRLSADEYEEAFERLYRQSQRLPYKIKTTEAPHYRRFVLQQSTKQTTDRGRRRAERYVPLNINDGNGVMFISHAGLVYPSGYLPIICGIFPLQHVVEIYQRSPIFCKLRDVNQLQGKCQRCGFRKVCGGSRARAHATTGNLFAEDPDCGYVPAETAAT